VTNRKDESVATGPAVVSRIVTHNFVEQGVGNRREADSGTWVAISNLFNCVSSKNSGGIYGFLVKF
jgi:hypothetical protein